MHFTTLFILKGETLENISSSQIEDMFSERYCYCCGETRPTRRYWCDWFQIGGRWCDILKAKNGIHGEKSWCNEEEQIENDKFSIVEIKDLTEKIDRSSIYAVANKTTIYDDSKEKFNKLLDDIDNKKFNGVIAVIDCHD